MNVKYVKENLKSGIGANFMPIYEFTCLLGHTFEERCSYDVSNVVSCPACGQPSQRQSVYLITPFTETGVAIGRLSTIPRDEKRINLKKFQEASAEIDHTHKKLEESAGHSLPTKDYYHEGLRQADLVRAGKRPAPKEF